MVENDLVPILPFFPADKPSTALVSVNPLSTMSTSHHMMDHDMPMPGHGDHGSTDKVCSMNMLFTWDYNNLCVVFKWWHISTVLQLALSMLVVAVLGAGYEYLRCRIRKLDNRNVNAVANPPSRLQLAVGYGAQVFYSYMLMLVFMTYNGWIMIAVSLGAVAGFYLWGNVAERQMMCH